MKTQFKIPIYIVVFFLMSIFFIFIHELSHSIVSMCSGNEFVKIVFVPIKKDSLFWGIAIQWNRVNYDIFWLEVIAGSLGSSIMSLFFIIFAIKRENMLVLLVSFINLFGESLHWCLGSLFNFGDPSSLFWYFEYQKQISYNSLYFFYSFLIVTIVIFCLYQIALFNLLKIKRIDKYGE